MGIRYDNRFILTNTAPEYAKIREAKNVKKLKHYNTGRLYYPRVRDMRQIQQIQHVWSTGDRYYKLAAQYYGNASLWWVIAQFNQKPTETALELGQIIYIPTPIGTVLNSMTRSG